MTGSHSTFTLPDLGEGLTEATLIKWLVEEGETIEVDQPVAEVETAKSVIDVPSPYAGEVVTLHGAADESLEVGAPLITVDTGPGGSETAGALPHREEERAGTAPEGNAGDAPEEKAVGGSGNVLIGYGTSESRRRRRRGATPTRRTRAEQPAPTGRPRSAGEGAATGQPEHSGHAGSERRLGPAGEATSARHLEHAEPGEHLSRGNRAPRVSSPLVRRLASDNGIDVRRLRGSGPDGLIVRSDVQAAVEERAAGGTQAAASTTMPPAQGHDGTVTATPPPAAMASYATPSTSPPDPATGLEVRERLSMTGIRLATATKLSRSRREIPEATVWQDVDVTELVRLRARLKAGSAQGAPSVLAFLGRYVLAGLTRYPELSSRIDATTNGGQEIVRFEGVNLGFAAQTPKGLVVPVVSHAERLSAQQLHAEIGRLVHAAREGTIAGRELSGGTFTVNNYGVFGSDGATPIINHPEVAILGLGRIIDRPWVVDGELAVRKVSTLTLAFDHRVCDGGTAGGFLDFVAGCMADPASASASI